jgi:small conductance mechanosensitive channel
MIGLAAPVDEGLIDACGENPSFFCEATWNLTNNRLISRAADWFVAKPLLAVLIFLITVLVNRWLRQLVTKLVVRVSRRDELAAQTLEKIGLGAPSALTAVDPRAAGRERTLTAVARAGVSGVVWTVGVLMILGVFNLDLAPLLAGAGIAGIAIGLGAQSLVKDCIAGFFIILEDQFGVGDETDLGQATGIVEALTLRSTSLRSADGTFWTIPNGAIVRVGNQSKLWSKAVLDMTIWYEADVDQALAVMQRVAAEVCALPEFEETVLDPPSVLGVERLTTDGMVLRVVVRTAPGAQWKLMRVLRSALKSAFETAGLPLHRP